MTIFLDDDLVASGGSATLLNHNTDVAVPSIGPVATADALPYPSGIYVKLIKPLIDRSCGALLLILCAPVLLVCAIAVRVSLGPGVLFRQARVGHGGRTFTVLKFRTMQSCRRANRGSYSGADRRVRHKDPEDPRMTRVGRFLRKWSLDELPQFINIVKGDMSLVGPRPELPFIVGKYTTIQHCRHHVKPGLTGLWQISERGHGEMHDFVHVDLDYVRRVSPLLDLKVLLLTPMCMMGSNRGF